MALSIRSIYESIGVEAFYSSTLEYKNPHSREIEELLRRHAPTLPLDNVLDLGCGTGLVTSILKSLGFYSVIGLDPFRASEYTTCTGRPCLKMSFKDIVNEGLPKHDFSVVICSFALHLCNRDMLPGLIWRLSERSNTLVVISPTKFPLIGKPVVEDFCRTPRNKRVHFRIYKLPIVQDI